MDIEKRVEALEAKITYMEDRRKALLGDLDENPQVKVVLKDSIDGFRAKLQLLAERREVDLKQTRFNNAVNDAHREMERIMKEGEQKELAELVAAIQYFEKTGRSPAGYDISV